jgi:hypothetical protein
MTIVVSLVDARSRRDGAAGRPLRRYPHLTRADVRILRALPDAASREFEAWLREQHAVEELRFETREDGRRVALEVSVPHEGVGSLEAILAARQGQSYAGTGGGHHRHRHHTDPEAA